MSKIHRAPAPPRNTKSLSHNNKLLKIQHTHNEYQLNDQKISIGRHKHSTICLSDPLVSGNHCVIINSFITDLGSTKGTTVNNTHLHANDRHLLKHGDTVVIGEAVMNVVHGEANKQSKQDLNRSKKFINISDSDTENHNDRHNINTPITLAATDTSNNVNKVNSKLSSDIIDETEPNMTVLELMKHEFDRIIGHENIKQQLRQFYKKVQLDDIRLKNNKDGNKHADKDKVSRLYHMIFSGPRMYYLLSCS